MTGIGAELGRIRLPLEPVKVAELAIALRAGPEVVPPTATVLAAHHTAPGGAPNELIIRAAELDPARVLLGDLAWTYHRPLRPGAVLSGAVRLLCRTVRQGRRGGTLVLAKGVTEWSDAQGPVVDCEVTLIEPAVVASSGGDRATGAARAQGIADGGQTPVSDDERHGDGVDPGQMRLTRTDIVRYAGASGDYNPVHHDEPYARRLGYPGVFAMGLLPGGILAARAERLLAPAPLARLHLRFSGQVWPEHPYRVRGRRLDSEPRFGPGLELALTDQDGCEVLRARAFPGQEQTGGR